MGEGRARKEGNSRQGKMGHNSTRRMHPSKPVFTASYAQTRPNARRAAAAAAAVAEAEAAEGPLVVAALR